MTWYAVAVARRLAPQANLQRRILFALAGEPTPTIVALASRVSSTRPAVSRSLKTLNRLGLVESRGRSWSVTVAGRVAVANDPSPYTAGVQRAVARQAALDHQLGLTLTRLARSQASQR